MPKMIKKEETTEKAVMPWLAVALKALRIIGHI
jgi:hypothetical protein